MAMRDAVTDLLAEPVAFRGGYAHAGMLEAARWFENSTQILVKLNQALRQHPSYGKWNEV